MIIYISDIVDVKVLNQVIKLTVIQDLFLVSFYLKKLIEKIISQLKKINNKILLSIQKTMLISNGFGIILTYAGRIIKTS
jgi:hypothetical protein